MDTLRDKQQRFPVLVARLILKAYELGYTATLGDAFRDPRLHGEVGERKGYGHRNSAHKRRLAIDLNLYRDGNYLTETEDYQPLGQWWQTQGGAWGGDFGDGNHFSLEHEGVR